MLLDQAVNTGKSRYIRCLLLLRLDKYSVGVYSHNVFTFKYIYIDIYPVSQEYEYNAGVVPKLRRWRNSICVFT
jgi:hypothetical protein